jgi:hypothetical protein
LFAAVQWLNVGGARLANAPGVFCLFRNTYFWQLGSRRANKKIQIFQNDYLGGVETEKLKKKICVSWDAN